MGEIYGHVSRVRECSRRGIRTYNQIADEDLKDLGLQALTPTEDLLEEADQDVP
jgi:DNA-binding SARP family transcriptional activator